MGFFSNIIDSVNRIVGESFIRPWLWVIILILFILGLYFFMTMKLGNITQGAEKKITYQYDKMLYLWSLFYNDHLDVLKTNPGVIIFRAITGFGKSKYVLSRKLIKESNSKIEAKLGTKVIPDAERKELSKLFLRYNIRKYVSILLKGIIILLMVVLFFLLIVILWK